MSSSYRVALQERQWSVNISLAQKTMKRIFCIGVSIALVLPLLTACQGGIANMPQEVASPEAPASSLSGKYILVVLSGYDGQSHFHSFQILNQDRKVLYLSPDHFEARFRTYFLWDQDERVWVYSSDLGTFFWERRTDTDEWEKHSYAQSNVPAPDFLKEMIPKRFNR